MSESHTETAQGTGGSVLYKIYEGVFLLVLLFVFLWNWDGFWQTDVNWLSKTQQSVFPSKFSEEQLKVSRVADNTRVFEQITERLVSIEEKNQRLYDQKQQADRNLDQYVNLENEKCRYYDTALRMLDHLSKKYSEHELKRVLSCTSAECEQILENRELAQKVCTANSVSSYYGQ